MVSVIFLHLTLFSEIHLLDTLGAIDLVSPIRVHFLDSMRMLEFGRSEKRLAR
jgi:hypothetical protein